MADTFAYSEDQTVATIRLNRPERLNALTFDTYRELTDTMRSLAARDDIRAVVVTGSGRAFCSGGDVEDIIGKLLNRSAEELLEFTRLTCDLIRAMRALPRPIVASLNGTVAGSGRRDRDRVRHTNRSGEREDRLPVRQGRALRRGHGRRGPAAAHRRPRARPQSS